MRLRIYEGNTFEERTDITFDYNANFFLYASLEPDRAASQGHPGPPPPQGESAVVLTGSPVASTAYLDRPELAGYFVFPDLSVRYEGFYTFKFELYESVKDPMDCDPNMPEKREEAYEARMAVRSDTFQAFSAKKFPGLMQSTELSRVIQEQGCRVRIRRDTRMRRRDRKRSSHNDHDRMEDEKAATRGRAAQTPDVPADAFRHRSISNSSGARVPLRSPSVMSRRPSASEYPLTPSGFQGPSAPPPFAAEPSSHLNFIQTSSNGSYAYPNPSPTAASPTSPHPPTTPNDFGRPSAYPPVPQGPTYSDRAYQSPTTEGHGHHPDQVAPYDPRSHSEKREARYSNSSSNTDGGRLPRFEQSSESSRVSLPSISFLLNQVSSNNTPNGDKATPPSSAGSTYSRAPVYDSYPAAQPVAAKRSYDDTFSTSERDARLVNGSRPADPQHVEQDNWDHQNNGSRWSHSEGGYSRPMIEPRRRLPQMN